MLEMTGTLVTFIPIMSFYVHGAFNKRNKQ